MNHEEHYKLILQEHRSASALRLKSLTTWAWGCIALAALFIWAGGSAPEFLWIICLLGALFTGLIWLLDQRHRAALSSLTAIGAGLESTLFDASSGETYFASLSARNEEDLASGKAILSKTIDFASLALGLALLAAAFVFSWFSGHLLLLLFASILFALFRYREPLNSGSQPLHPAAQEPNPHT